MRIEPLNFKDFDSGIAVIRDTGAKTFLPGGRRRSEAPPPPPPIFNEEQLKAAEREAYKKGFLAGIEEGKKQQDSEQAATDRKLMGTIENLLATVAPIFADYRNTITKAREAMPKVALTIAHKVAAAALTQSPQAAVEETAAKCVELMLGEPKLVITVHASLADALKQKVTALATRLQSATDIIVVGDAGMPQTDCRIEWKDGQLVRDTAKLWQDITKTVENMSASAGHEAKTNLDALQQQIPATPETTNAKKE